jgi:hypothetical protein
LASLVRFVVCAALAGVACVSGDRRPASIPRPAHLSDAVQGTLGKAALETVKLVDLDGVVHTLGEASNEITAVVFVGPECPLSQKYVPTLNALARDTKSLGVRFIAAISDPSVARPLALRFRKDYAVEFPVVLDTSGDLAAELEPTRTPEAFVIGRDARVHYRGRIDDQYAALGRRRVGDPTADLNDAIQAVAAGVRPAHDETESLGCALDADRYSRLTKQVTYTRHITPILQAHCASCHRPQGVGPFPLLSYEDASKRAQMIATVTESRYMPPWHAAPHYGAFKNERRMTAREIALIAQWAAHGAPEGDSAEAPPPTPVPIGWTLGEPDLVMTLPRAHEVPAAAGRDVYRTFVFGTLAEDAVLKAVDFRPGPGGVVHHVNMFADAAGIVRRREQERAGKDATELGIEGIAPRELNDAYISVWSGGVFPARLPPGVGRPLKKGSDIVLEVHFRPTGRVVKSESALALYFAHEPVQRTALMFRAGTRKVDIPAGEPRYRVAWDDIVFPVPMKVLAARGHMHLLGKEMKVAAELPSGSPLPVLWLTDWNYEWQPFYEFTAPLELPKGTRLRGEAFYDNSEENPLNPHRPPQRVKWGWNLDDEMCSFYLDAVFDRQEDVTVFKQWLSAYRARQLASSGTQAD